MSKNLIKPPDIGNAAWMMSYYMTALVMRFNMMNPSLRNLLHPFSAVLSGWWPKTAASPLLSLTDYAIALNGERNITTFVKNY